MSKSHDESLSLPWYRSLRWQLPFINLILLGLIASAAIWLNQNFVQKPLEAEATELFDQREAALQNNIAALLENAEQFSSALAATASTAWGNTDRLRFQSENILRKISPNSGIIAAGIWPEPRAFNTKRERFGFYWTLESSSPNFRNDYNDPANISYHGERWYSPVRYLNRPGCFWTDSYAEPFLRKSVVSCSVPIYRKQTFVGVSNLVLDIHVIADKLVNLAPDNDKHFFMLFDRESKLIANSSGKELLAEHIAELARKNSILGPVAVRLHNQDEELRKQQADEIDKAALESLLEKSRKLSRLKGELLLADITRPAVPLDSNEEFEVQAKLQSPVIKYKLTQFGQGRFRLLVGENQGHQVRGFDQTFLFSALSTAGMILVAVFLSYQISRRTLIAPLQGLLEQLRRNPEDSYIEHSGQNEVALVSAWLNERNEQIRDLNTRISAQRHGLSAGQQVHTPQEGISNDQQAWAALDAISDAVVVTNQDSRLVYINAAAESLCGWNRDQAAGLNFDEVFHVLDRRGKQRLEGITARCMESERRSERPLQALFKTRSGHELPVAVSTAPIQDASEQISGALVTLHDSRSEQAQQDSQNQSIIRDPLTSCLNRQAFDAELASRCEATRLGGAAAFAMLYIDVDNMRRINDACGSDGGDELLRQLSKLIQSDVGDANPVYRLQSDKFAVLLSTSDAAEAQVTAELLRADVQSWGYKWKSQSFEISITAALVMVDRDSGRPLDVLRSADELCQGGKAEGRNRVISGHAKMVRGERRQDKSWLTNIKRGLAEDRFHLSTQQIKALQRRADGGEVYASLLLLEDEEGFWSGAESFMAAAERHNIAVELDRWVIEHLFGKIGGDEQLGKHLDFCLVPLSVTSLQSASFLDFVLESFNKFNVHPAKLCFELNEHDIQSRLSSAREFIQALSRAGCRFCISQISTAPNSYSLIKELPVDYVKVDTLLSRKAEKDPSDRLALESLHKITQNLGKKTIVSQVDNAELLRIVQGIGVDYAQGNAVARTTPILFQAQV